MCRSLFVSWYLGSGRNDPEQSKEPRLRGCIGTFYPQDLASGLDFYAKQAAFHDHRFRPITYTDIPKLQCSVSLLSPFEPCDDYLDWELGTHGVYIRFSDPAARESPAEGAGARLASCQRIPRPAKVEEELTATFLPEVAVAQGWTKMGTIEMAIRKAGWNGKITENLLGSLRVFRYSSSKMTVDYDEFDTWSQRASQLLTH